MKINLIQNEIESAIEQYVKQFITIPEGKHFKIEMSATRGSSGITAEINIEDNTEQAKTFYAENHEDCNVKETKEVKEELPVAEPEVAIPKKSFFANLN